MAGTLKHRHQTALANTGADVSANAWNDSFVAAGGVDAQVATRDSTAPDGWDWKAAAAIIPADSLTLAQGVAVATYQLTTLGTYDWLFPNGSTTLPKLIAAAGLHEKGPGGGWLSEAFQWIENGVAATLFTQNITPAITTTAADDAANAAAAGALGGQGIFTTAGSNYGFRLRVPGFPTARTLVVYSEFFSCQVIAKAVLHGQTLTTQTVTTTNGAASTAAAALWTMAFTAPLSGQLVFSLNLATVLGVNQSPSVKFGFAYLA